MQVTIRQLCSGLIGKASKKQLARFELDDLPAELRERARRLIGPDAICGNSRADSTEPRPDSLQYEFEYRTEQRMTRMRVNESACAPEVLDLLDDLRDCLD